MAYIESVPTRPLIHYTQPQTRKQEYKFIVKLFPHKQYLLQERNPSSFCVYISIQCRRLSIPDTKSTQKSEDLISISSIGNNAYNHSSQAKHNSKGSCHSVHTIQLSGYDIQSSDNVKPLHHVLHNSLNAETNAI
jgi:hypothetical protein